MVFLLTFITKLFKTFFSVRFFSRQNSNNFFLACYLLN
ncbi:hypothetical protein N408_06635 [Helicobacter pylori FD703]|nr:hypothetical protein N408_06635 [Helicobacter pylori FD703]